MILRSIRRSICAGSGDCPFDDGTAYGLRSPTPGQSIAQTSLRRGQGDEAPLSTAAGCSKAGSSAASSMTCSGHPKRCSLAGRPPAAFGGHDVPDEGRGYRDPRELIRRGAAPPELGHEASERRLLIR